MGCRLEHYRVVEVLGVGGFGVTYLAEHQRLGLKVALKEYLPNEFAVRDGTTVHPKSGADKDNFEWGLARFLEEAQTLTGFRHPNLVQVRDYFEANQTAYFVMDYEVGQPLNRLLANGRLLSERQLRRVLWPIIDGLKVVHAAGVLHRDIKPANIFVRQANESPVLLDFGAARSYARQQTKSMTAMASPGYSAPEQYYGSEAQQGPWTDIYSLAAVCWRAIDGNMPPEAPRRLSSMVRDQPDPLPALSGRVDGYSPSFLRAVDAGLKVIETERPQDLDSWLQLFTLAEADSKAPAKQPVEPAASTDPPESSKPEIVKALPASGTASRSKRVSWTASALAALVLAIAASLYWITGWRAPPVQTAPLVVVPTPADASLTIQGIGPYRPGGVSLPPGDYVVEASAPGYGTKELTVAHDAAPTRVAVALELATAPFTVNTTPADALVTLVDGPAGRQPHGRAVLGRSA